MKKIFMLTAVTMLSLSSCQNDELQTSNQEELQTSNQSQEDLAIAIATAPKSEDHLRPFIIQENSSFAKTQAPPGTGWGNPAQVSEFNHIDGVRSNWNIVEPPRDQWGNRVSRSKAGRWKEMTYWGWEPGNVSVSNGILYLKSKKDSKTVLFCAAINGNDKSFEKKYGYFEASIWSQNPGAVGSHTSMWLQGDNMGNTSSLGNNGAEIDIYESCWTDGKSPTTIHIDGYDTSHQSIGGEDFWSTRINFTNWHTYGLLWNKKELIVYYDGNQVKKFTNPNYTDQNPNTNDKWIPDVHEYVIISTGAAFGYKSSILQTKAIYQNSGANSFPGAQIGKEANSLVSYVHYWTKSGDSLYQ